MADPEATAQFEQGNVLHARGDLAGAEASWRAASQGSHHAAALSLGTLLYQRGDWVGAEDEWAFAVGADDRGVSIRAVTNYGRLISEREFDTDTTVGRGRNAKSIHRDTSEADSLWGAAAESGDDEAAWAYIGLGRLYDPTELADEPDPKRSEWGFERAATSGHPDAGPCASFKLARLREHLGRNDGSGLGAAIDAYERGAASGHAEWAPRCANRLGELRADAGEIDEAQRWWRLVVESGHPGLAPIAERALAPKRRWQDDADVVFELDCDEGSALDRFDDATARLGWSGEVESAGSYDHTTHELGPNVLAITSKGGFLSKSNRIVVFVKQGDGNRTQVGLMGGTPAERQKLQRALERAR